MILSFYNLKKNKNTVYSRIYRLIKSSLDYLNLHYSERITVRHMSEYCHLSIQHFSRLFKSYTGKTFIEYLTLFRLEQARKILSGTDIPIIQIPDLVGFCNGNYFSRLYKKYYGHPPSMGRSC
jgi:AraC family transcriptional regulator, transcriptional activator of pobA